MNLNPHTERYYRRQCEIAIQRKPVDLDIEEMYPFEENTSTAALDIWNEIAHGVIKKPRRTNKNLIVNYDPSLVDEFKCRHHCNNADLALMVGISHVTMERISMGEYPYRPAVEKVFAFIKKYM